ncbi:MAG: ABC transporter permease [Phycisphaeraceae bacterium]
MTAVNSSATWPADAPPPLGSEPVTVIQPRRGVVLPSLAELWRRKDLLWLLTARDLSVRYKQTALGAIWAVLRPVVGMIVMSVFFGGVLGVAKSVEGVAYPVFLYAGLLPWQLFTAAVTASSNSLVANGGMLKKVYFPRVIVPLSAIGAPLVDFAIACGILAGIMAWYGIVPQPELLLAPVLLLAVLTAVTGFSLLLSAVSVSFRDVGHAVPFMLQMLLFMTPVIYPVKMVPEAWRWVLMLNPLSGPIESFRAVLLGTPVDWIALAVSWQVAAVMTIAGLAWFGIAERKFADIV